MGRPKPDRLSAEQLEALRKYAAENGRCWKSQLHYAWMAGGYDSKTGHYIDGQLQQIRNMFGHSWLINFSLKKAEALYGI